MAVAAWIPAFAGMTEERAGMKRALIRAAARPIIPLNLESAYPR